MSAQQLPLAGKTAVVTGAASGLGKAIATVFLSAGAAVVVADVNQARLDEVKAELSQHENRLITFRADIAAEDSVEALFKQAQDKFGRIDVVVNNAGIMDHFDAVGDLDKALWDHVIAVNLTGTYLVSKAAVRHMLDAAGEGKAKGVILNVSSLGGAYGFRAGAAYTASKHGVVGLTKNTAAFYGKKGIRCNAILPGGMPTNVAEALFKDGKMSANMEGLQIVQSTQTVHKENSEVADMADLCLYLCSDRAVVLNGACVHADGGWSAF